MLNTPFTLRDFPAQAAYYKNSLCSNLKISILQDEKVPTQLYWSKKGPKVLKLIVGHWNPSLVIKNSVFEGKLCPFCGSVSSIEGQ